MTEFVSQFSDILDFDSDQNLMVIELRAEERATLESAGGSVTSGRIRIRGDFWRAILDRSSVNKYYWLADIGVVGTSPTDGNCPTLPTIDAETDRKWRQSFVASLPYIPDEATEWATSLLPSLNWPQN